MEKIIIKKLFTGCVMNVVEDETLVNKFVKPNDIVQTTSDVLNSLDSLEEKYQKSTPEIPLELPKKENPKEESENTNTITTDETEESN